MPFWGTLRESSPRYRTWLEILGGSETVPVVSFATHDALLGEESAEVYDIDIMALTHPQRQRLAAWIANKFDEPQATVEADLPETGFPIRAADVIVSMDMRMFL